MHQVNRQHDAIRRHAHCGAVLVIHRDRTATCSAVECPASELFERMVDAHASFAPCEDLFDASACPRCKTGIADRTLMDRSTT